MTPEDARYAALKSFGRVDQSKEECRDARGVGFIENLLRHASYSLRVLLKNYAFTIVVILTLALGIGANTRDRCAHGVGRDDARCFQVGLLGAE